MKFCAWNSKCVICFTLFYQSRNIIIFEIHYLNKQNRNCSHELTPILYIYKNTPIIISLYSSSFGTFSTVLNQIKPRDKEICLHFKCGVNLPSTQNLTSIYFYQSSYRRYQTNLSGCVRWKNLHSEFECYLWFRSFNGLIPLNFLTELVVTSLDPLWLFLWPLERLRAFFFLCPKVGHFWV